MANSRPKKEEKNQSVTEGGFFSDTNKDQPFMPVTEQLLKYSCVPFGFAQLFTKIIKESEPNLPLKDSNRILRLFEIGIYPEIWKKPFGESDETKSLQYMMKYLKKDPEIMAEQKDIQSISPTDKTIWFVLGKTSAGPHVALVRSEGNKFICEGKSYDYLMNTLQDITKVYAIEQSNINIQLIHESVKNYDKEIKEAFLSYGKHPLSGYYTGNLFYCCPFFSIKESFPEASKIITEQFLQNPNQYPILGRHMARVLQEFPDWQKGIEKIFTVSPKSCFESFDDIEAAVTLFPDFKDIFSERVLLKQPEKFLKSYSDVEKAIQLFPDDEEDIQEAAIKCKLQPSK